MTTQLAKNETKNLSVVHQEPGQQIIASDIVVPRLLLMQPMSKAVTAKKAQVGEMVRSTTLAKVGDENKGVSFIPLKMTTGWIEEEKVGQKFEYRKTMDRTPANDGLTWTFYRDAQGKEAPTPFPGSTEWRRVKTINVYALLKEDLDAYTADLKKAEETGEMPDFTKGVMPVLITFRSSSFNAGKSVNNYFALYEKAKRRNPGLKSYGFYLDLTCRIENGKKGTYYLYEIGKTTPVEAVNLAEAEEWYGFLNKVAAVVVDDSHMDAEDGEVTSGSRF